MSLLLNWRVWALVALMALIPTSYLKGRNDGRKLERLEFAGATAQANREAARLERARQSRADDAGRLARAREAGIRADADRARGELGGLRDDLGAIERASAQSLAAANSAVRVIGDVLQSCTAEYQRMAEEADRATSEARELRQAWPSDKP